jgi:hydroxymethylbilane synthase
MAMRRKIVIGTRGSRLALVQADYVTARISKINPDIEITIARVVTSGDRHRERKSERISEAGIFTKELEEALRDGRVDLAVHSLKDLPTQIPQDLCLVAVPERLDPRDALVVRSGLLKELPRGSRIGTDSLRRAVELVNYRQDLEVCHIRGNVDTRLRKVFSGEFDGIITAAAALLRLDREDSITEYLPLEHFLPAAGQGALGLEARLDDREIAELVAPLNNLPAWQSTAAERAFIRALGGGCRSPMAVLGTVSNATLKLEGMVADLESGEMLRASEEGTARFPEEIGARLAQKMLETGASRFITGAGVK